LDVALIKISLSFLKKIQWKIRDSKKKVILVFDEIFVRESLNVNTRNLTYNGLENYGDEFKPKTFEKANHALVLMIQGLADHIHQPIAMFASKGPVKGH